MFKITSYLTFFAALTCLNMYADESPAQPKIITHFYSAESIHILPNLKYLDAQDPGFSKVEFTLEGFPQNQEIALEIKRLWNNEQQEYNHLLAFTIQDDGSYLIHSQPPKKSDSIVISSKGFLPGERVFYYFHTADDSVSKEVSGIPAPAIARDESGKVAVRAELVSIEPTVYDIDFPLMTEGEEYDLKTTSLGVTATASPKYVKGKPMHYSPSSGTKGGGGESFLEITRKSGEIYYIKLPWGKALNVHLKGLKPHAFH